ncbi:MAG: hypothetical protein J1F33_03805 [Clostridiales bacterium]|nr:hypothetical protein [Clostridiales bacterium]
MKKKCKLSLYLLSALIGLSSIIISIIIEVKFLNSKVVWQNLLGAGWTILSIFIVLFGLIGIFNTMNEKEPLQKKKIYLNVDGKQKSFRDKEKFIKLEDIKQFLMTSNTPEKIFILSENDIYCSFEVYMEPINPYRRIVKYDFNTRQFFINETNYKNIDDAIEYLMTNKFVLKDDNVCVIGYEYSSPYHLQKRIENKV